MIQPLPSRRLPERPDLDQLKLQAKELLRDFTSHVESAIAEVTRFYRDAEPAAFALHHAQLVLARSYGFDSWPKLKAYVDGVTVDRLVSAVRANDLEQVRGILRVRPELINVAMAWNNSHTALHYAVLGQMPDMVRLLMEHGADAHAGISPHNDATSALTIAVERGYDEIAAIIRDVEQHRTSAPPPADEMPRELRQVLQVGDEDQAIALLEQHPQWVGLRLRGERWTLLHVASAMLLDRLAAWLLDRGVDANEKAPDGSTALDVLGRYSDDSRRRTAMQTLLRCGGVQLTARSAVILGDAEFLRKHQTELVAPQDDRGWLLTLAVEHDRPEILTLLLDLGLDPDARVRVESEGVEEIAYSWGMPLYECARSGKHQMAEILLERGADPNARVYASGTPLSEAFGQRDERMIALLERYGGKPNASMAGLYRRRDLAEKLLAEHGDARLPDDGFSSGTVAEQLLGAAARGGDPEILRMAMERVDFPSGDPRWNGLLQAPLGFWNHWIGPWCHHEWDRTTYLECFRMILERCGPPNARLRFGTTILHETVTMGDHTTPAERVAFAAAALDAGARLDMRDDLLKSTPLGWACRWGRIELVRLFLERGADAAEPDAEPWATPAAWAAKKGHQDVIAILSS